MTLLSLVGHIAASLATSCVVAGYEGGTPKVTPGIADGADFQTNIAFSIAKTAGKKPIEVANTIVAHLNGSIIGEAWTSGAGFINLKVTNTAIDTLLTTFKPTCQKTGQRIVLDYGGPNLAKALHVGHLRSLVIGESLRRILIAAGHEVISDIHFGDWGMPLGMLISEIELHQPGHAFFGTGPYPIASPVSMEELSTLYPKAVSDCKSSPEREAIARRTTLALQQGDPGYLALWASLKALSTAAQFEDIDLLGARFDLLLGESDVSAIIPEMLKNLVSDGYATTSLGALVIEVAQPNDKKSPLRPLVLQKPDGAVLYATTDLATIQQRKESLGPDKVIYVVDARQGEHFEQLFRASEKIGLMRKDQLVHASFGTVNGSNGTPLKTRSGGTVRLKQLLSDAVEAASRKVNEAVAAGRVPAQEAEKLALQIGIGALKFADLSSRRQSGYTFDAEKMVALEGKSGGYLQYSAVRISSILQKAQIAGISPSEPNVSTAAERALGMHILAFHDALGEAERSLEPFEVANYAFELAQAFSRLYGAQQIMNVDDLTSSHSLLGLCQVALDALSAALNLLAIEQPDRM